MKDINSLFDYCWKRIEQYLYSETGSINHLYIEYTDETEAHKNALHSMIENKLEQVLGTEIFYYYISPIERKKIEKKMKIGKVFIIFPVFTEWCEAVGKDEIISTKVFMDSYLPGMLIIFGKRQKETNRLTDICEHICLDGLDRK